jgi:Clp protease
MNINILFTGGVTPELAAQFHTVCTEVARSSASQLSVHIASRGGDVNSGMAMYNALKLLPCKVRTINMGQCGSIAATLYMAGAVRQVMPGANFFLHAACYIEGPLKGQVSPSTGLIVAPFRDDLCWGQERLDCYFASPDEKYLSADEAAAISMVTDLTPPAPWAKDDLSIVLNPHGSEVPGMERFIARLHGAAKAGRAKG